ncbi:MAG TPA: (Na+)-NQR maturation NqrM [Cellvibrio sp.]|nr:(Na+)-NQR maturation NqrM [Cellvibrio sp.]
MGTLLVTLVFMLVVVALMSVGVIFGRKPITGSCGGVGKALGEKEYVCDICGGDESKCEEKQQAAANAEKSLAYEVTTNKK